MNGSSGWTAPIGASWTRSGTPGAPPACAFDPPAMYLARTPALAKRLMGGLVWGMPGRHKDLYLTCDDGPDPEVTPWVLDTLARSKAKATFFCTGRNAEANPALMDRLRREGHSVGNHTWDHPDGWRTPTAS